MDVIESSNNSICRNTIINSNVVGIRIKESFHNNFTENNIINTEWNSVSIFYSSNNIFSQNNIINTNCNLFYFWQASNNLFYNNTFIDDIIQIDSYYSNNLWYFKGHGNFWNDYEGEDLDGDGIGETLLPHHEDYYPLTVPFSSFPILWDNTLYFINISSNSTVSRFSLSFKLIKFNVTGPDGTFGFFNITMPIKLQHKLFPYTWRIVVLIDDKEVDYTLVKNATHSFLYFTYIHTTHMVKIAERPITIIIDKSVVSKSRCDVGSTQYVYFHAIWSHNDSSVNGGTIFVNGTPYLTNSTGWVRIPASSSVVARKIWSVTSVNCSGVTEYIQNATDPSIIWDRVSITLSIADDRIDVGSMAQISWSGHYEFDSEVFNGQVIYNDTLIKNVVGKFAFTTVNIVDPLYGLSAFRSNTIYCIWDRMKIVEGGVTHPITNITQTETIWFKVIYEYDEVEFDASKGIVYINGSAMSWSSINDRWEYNYTLFAPGKRMFQISSITDNFYGLSAINDVVGAISVTWNHFRVVYNETEYIIPITTNSIISNFIFDQPNKQISYTIKGEKGTIGYCNIIIPKKLLKAEPLSAWVITLDDTPIPYSITDNATHTFISFQFLHSIHTVKIIGTEVIPEFPSTITLLLMLMGISIIAIVKRKVLRKFPT